MAALHDLSQSPITGQFGMLKEVEKLTDLLPGSPSKNKGEKRLNMKINAASTF